MQIRLLLPLWVLIFSISALDCGDSYTPKSSLSDPISTVSAMPAGIRYIDDIFPASSIVVITNVLYSSAFNPYTMVIDNLRLDIYRAEGDTSRSRWVLIFAYGGGFWQGSKTSVPDNIEFCKEMAQKGYFVVSINYRLLPHSPAFESDSLRIIAGTPLAGSDVRAAVRFIKSKVGQWPIDSTKIITHGTSSGGFSALAAGVWPEIDSLNFSNLGYSGTPSLASAGAGGLPDTLVVTVGDPPLYLAHCLFDPAVPFAYSEDVASRAQNIGVPVKSWWLSDDCHGIIKCCRSDMVQNLAQWIYDSF